MFGHEAPDVQSVEKVTTIDPEHVTLIAYVDEQGRTIATRLSSNSSTDTVKIVSLAPDEGFSNATPLEGTQVNDFKWEVLQILLDRGDERRAQLFPRPAPVPSPVRRIRAACDYQVRFKLIETDELDILLEDSLIITGEQLRLAHRLPLKLGPIRQDWARPVPTRPNGGIQHRSGRTAVSRCTQGNRAGRSGTADRSRHRPLDDLSG